MKPFRNRIRIAGIQVYRRPTLLLDAIRKASLQALYLPDRKRILLDGRLPEKKHRWHEAHEIGHSLIPWHEEVMLGDNSYLSQDCHEQVEAEANFAAARRLARRATVSIVVCYHGFRCAFPYCHHQQIVQPRG